MNEAKRAYDLMRSYVNQEWDRIRGVDWDEAWKELQKGPNPPQPTQVQGVSIPAPTAQPAAPEDTARQILGVKPGDDFETIRAAFEKLNKRSQPANFNTGSEESEAARQLQIRIQWAYNMLTQGTSESEKRFKSLEIE